jgi:hypothetical protein
MKETFNPNLLSNGSVVSDIVSMDGYDYRSKINIKPSV